MWFALLLTGVMLTVAEPLLLVFGPFASSEACGQFVQSVLAAYDEQASGTQIAAAHCVEPHAGIWIDQRTGQVTQNLTVAPDAPVTKP